MLTFRFNRVITTLNVGSVLGISPGVFSLMDSRRVGVVGTSGDGEGGGDLSNIIKANRNNGIGNVSALHNYVYTLHVTKNVR